MYFGFDLLERHALATLEGVLAVAPGATQIASRQAHKYARQPSVGRLTLQRFVNLDDLHRGYAATVTRVALKGHGFSRAANGLLSCHSEELQPRGICCFFRSDIQPCYSLYRAVVVSVSQMVTSFTRTLPLVPCFSRELVSSIEILGQVFRRRIDGGERLQLIHHLVVEIVHHRAQDVLQILKVQEQAGMVQGLAAKGHANAVVVAMGLFALAVVVAQVVPGGKGVFYSDFKHGLSTRGTQSRRSLGTPTPAATAQIGELQRSYYFSVFGRKIGAMHPVNQVIMKDPDILGGTPVFRGTRVPFQALLDYLEGGQTLAEFLNDFPTVSREAAVSALEAAKSLLVGQLG